MRERSSFIHQPLNLSGDTTAVVSVTACARNMRNETLQVELRHFKHIWLNMTKEKTYWVLSQVQTKSKEVNPNKRSKSKKTRVRGQYTQGRAGNKDQVRLMGGGADNHSGGRRTERGSATRLETGLRSIFKGQIRDPAQMPPL